MKTFTIDYEETYSGTFEVTLDDDATEQDAIDELYANPEYYRLGDEVECTDSKAIVTDITTTGRDEKAD
ncbi:hypothetical protein [Bifidobacterium biavatii]|uniref:Uncharacterized protein n=1 Tax=Bifidobacterium biavatii DSM 23969 TaxID=1437608 RepID=A0A086ZHX1_9BIFI|nr:hypothetical protein [Bifidobacterium biavatii]KFI46121.1 hypothetical protein BBIA_2086 [Bifidobacterium biavatii DSM 23969]